MWPFIIVYYGDFSTILVDYEFAGDKNITYPSAFCLCFLHSTSKISDFYMLEMCTKNANFFE